ncbi:hypothetical protein GOBAR_DD03974 [Gossypium barbadense]|nr:hypothetical protein GOBAR_DD03974 [Gossypium barbadense]
MERGGTRPDPEDALNPLSALLVLRVYEEASIDGQPPKLASIPASDTTVWADASPLLQAACAGLRDGELIHGDNFNLFAAMSALEVLILDTSWFTFLCHLCFYNLICSLSVFELLTYFQMREEDLFTMTYGLPLNGDGDDKCLSILNAVEETISRQLRACKATSSKRRLPEDLEPLQSNPNLEEGFCKALLCRLRFRKGRGLESARKHIASCLTELESILKSADFLRSCFDESCEGDIDDKTTASGFEPIGFDAMLNSRLSAPTPPRAIKILSWKKAVEYFVKLLHDLDVICSYSLDPHLESLLRFVVQFQKSQPDLVARSHLQILNHVNIVEQLLLVQDGKLYGRDPFFAVINKAAALPEATKNHDIQKNESFLQLGMVIANFLNSDGVGNSSLPNKLVMNLLKILCTNAAWQRRKLGKFLQDWRVIYVQLELAFRNEYGEVSSSSNDENTCMKIFQHILLWVEEQTYWIAFRFLILGFELELYSTGEYCMVYWYLYAVLIKLTEKTHLMMAVSHDNAKRKGKKKKDSPKDLARESRIPPAVLFLQCYICLAEGLSMMLAALRNEIPVFHSPSPFNTEHEKFVQHFELLQRACIPDHVSYPSYKESTTHARFSTLAMYNYFKDAQRIAKEVKSSFSNDPERLAELRKLEQVAEHNSVAQNVICRLGALDPSLKVSFEFSHHPFFATVVVKRS